MDPNGMNGMYGQEMGGAPVGQQNAGGQNAGMEGIPGFPINSAGMQYMMDTGRQYAEGIIGRIINIRELRKYFAVDTRYVLNKLKDIVFPYVKKGEWKRSSVMIKGENGVSNSLPRNDINAPDLYIPVMGFITYIVFCAMVAGFAGNFKPEILGLVASKALVVFALDVLLLKLGYYLLSSASQPLLDCVSMCGYVFVGVAMNELAQMIGGKWLLYPCLLFTCCGFGVFLMRSVRVVLLSDPAPAPADSYPGMNGYSEPSYGMNMGDGAGEDPFLREQNRRRYFLLFLAFAQLLVMYFLAFAPAVIANQQGQQYNAQQHLQQQQQQNQPYPGVATPGQP